MKFGLFFLTVYSDDGWTCVLRETSVKLDRKHTVYFRFPE